MIGQWVFQSRSGVCKGRTWCAAAEKLMGNMQQTGFSQYQPRGTWSANDSKGPVVQDLTYLHQRNAPYLETMDCLHH